LNGCSREHQHVLKHAAGECVAELLRHLRRLVGAVQVAEFVRLVKN
jgi:hypothetical protein